MTEIQETKECRSCALSIPAKAETCSHCGTAQKFFPYWFQRSSSPAALAISVATAAFSTYGYIHAVFSKPASEAIISKISVSGTDIRIVATNTGDAPALISNIDIRHPNIPPRSYVKFKDDQNALVQPGGGIIPLEVILFMDADSAQREASSLLQSLAIAKGGDVDTQAEILLSLEQSDGSYAVLNHKLTLDEAIGLFYAHADKCYSIETPNFLNGCSGTGYADPDTDIPPTTESGPQPLPAPPEGGKPQSVPSSPASGQGPD